MGFGSYDESEQKDQNIETDDDEAVTVHEHEHDGEVTLEDNDMTTSELLDQLPDDDPEDEE